MKVAVVRNRDNEGIVCRFGQACPEVYGKRTVQKVIDALRAGGHTVSVFEGDKHLIANLERFMPPDPVTGRPGGMVLNMSYGIQGNCRYSHVPGMLELAGILYTGSSPLGHALALDKVVTKILMQDAGVPTPDYCVMAGPGRCAGNLRFPLIVKPRHESTSYGLRLARDPDELNEAVLHVVTKYQQDALVEEYIEGREACVGLLGNDPVELFPVVELDFGGRQLQALTWEDKYHKSMDEPKKICPAVMGREMVERLHELSLATFRACHCKDYARVDIRIDACGNPFVLEINSMASLGLGGSFVLGAITAGYTFQSLISRILDVAHQRYFGTPAKADELRVDSPGEVLLQSGRPRISSGAAAQEDAAADTTEMAAMNLAPGQWDLSVQQTVVNHFPPHKVTRFYDEHIRRNGYYEQLARTVEPSPDERDGAGTLDTSGERDHTRVQGLQHKYRQTALLLVTDQCFSYCRFCFRKRLVGTSSQELVQDYGQVSAYISRHPEITDVLLSGGDPFVLDSEQLDGIMHHLLPIRHVTSIRFGTRGTTYYPPRFHDSRLVDLFQRIMMAGKTPVIVTHIDHIGEISKETEIVIKDLRTRGVQFLNQAVLLKDVNDDSDILAATFDRLHYLGVQPYYLFQARPVKGTAHFQVPLRRGVEIVRKANCRLSGLAKTYRYVMSHYTGKVEVLDIGQDNHIRMRYHQAVDAGKVGVVFSRLCCESACWLDDLPCTSDVVEIV